jgi:hypothetical protein
LSTGFNFFVSCEEFLRSTLGPGWRELPIFDCRLLMDIGRNCHTTFSIVYQQSAVKTWSWVAAEGQALYEDVAFPVCRVDKDPSGESYLFGP